MNEQETQSQSLQRERAYLVFYAKAQAYIILFYKGRRPTRAEKMEMHRNILWNWPELTDEQARDLVNRAYLIRKVELVQHNNGTWDLHYDGGCMVNWPVNAMLPVIPT